MVVLGLNAFHGDAAACLVVDGKIVAALEEERLTRVKHQAGFPREAVRWCLDSQGAELRDVDAIAVGRDPKAHVRDKALWALRHPTSRFVRERIANRARVRDVGELVAEAAASETAPPAPVRYVEHHRAHLASAFFCSPFEQATVLSLDGFGDFVSAMWGRGREGAIDVEGEVRFPHSLGIFYTALTQYLGFPRYGDEYKVMGLGAYGEPEYAEALRRVIRTDGDGFRLDPRYFRHASEGVEMTWAEGAPEVGPVWSPELERLLGPARRPDEPIEPRHEQIAASLQAVFEEIVFALLRRLAARHRLPALCYAGGVALNAVANGKLRAEIGFDDVFIQPAAYDAGTAIGAALHVWHDGGGTREYVMEHAYLGPEYAEDELAAAIERAGLRAERVGEEAAAARAAEAIADGKIVGWYQGRVEFGPRALGNRSIVVDARRPEMKDVLNARIKRREPFRPFAPSILAEATADYFEDSYPSPFMLMAYRVRPEKRDVIPAPTHVDGTGRLQTVAEHENPRYWRLLREVEARTGVPVVLNTSFNENEPIVCTPDEAVDCFVRTQMDLLVLGPFALEREAGARPAESAASRSSA